MPLAEEAGLILSIGEWVLRTACLEAAKWPEHIRVAVNLSPIQFVEPSLPATIVSALANAEHRSRASSSSRSPRACSWSKAKRPTTCSPS